MTTQTKMKTTPIDVLVQQRDELLEALRQLRDSLKGQPVTPIGEDGKLGQLRGFNRERYADATVAAIAAIAKCEERV